MAWTRPLLPRSLTPFLGREELVRRVVEHVADPDVPLLTLTGPGGVGKTRLALAAAEAVRRSFADGTLFVSLAPVVEPAGRALFRRLAVFRGGFALDDAEAVLATMDRPDTGGADVLDGVAALVDQSLQGASDEDGALRFRMLEPIREFSLERLVASGEDDRVWSSFADHWIAVAENTGAHTAELDDLNRAVAPLESNHDNIRAALDWLEAHDPVRAAPPVPV